MVKRSKTKNSPLDIVSYLLDFEGTQLYRKGASFLVFLWFVDLSPGILLSFVVGCTTDIIMIR